MLRVALKSLLARKLRLLMSTAAIVLGVAFVAGSLIFTDAMGGAFDDIIEGSTAEAEVGYQGAGDFDSAPDGRTLPAGLVDRLEDLPEVESAHPQNVLQTVFVIDDEGKVVGGNGPPGLAFNPTSAVSLTGEPVMELARGRLPDAPYEVALGEETAERAGYELGDEVTLATSATPPTLKAELVGLVDSGSSTVGATVTVFDTAFLQDYFLGGRNVFTSIQLNAAEGVSQAELADAAQKVLPQGVEARTGDDVVAANQNFLEEILGFLQTFLLVFATVSLVVGTFIIINTFSILVAQRSRELALLRALGASRRQVNASVMVEALVVGVVGSTVGLGAGWMLAHLLRLFFALFGLDLGGASFPVQPSTIGWSYAVGVAVTLAASVMPAQRASRIPPVAALRDDVALPDATLRRRVAVGVLLVLLGVGGMVLGFVGEGSLGLLLIGVGILLVLVGVALMSPVLGQPLLAGFGRLFRRTHGSVGAMAGGNVRRNPRRTGATASALMIGLTLMTMMSIFGASASASTDAAIGKSLTSQFVISNVVSVPFSPGVADEVEKLDGVAGVARMRVAYPEIEGQGFQYALAMDPAELAVAFDVGATKGSFTDLRRGTIALSEARAKAYGASVGDTVTMRLQAGEQELRVVATYPAGMLPGDCLVTPDTLTRGGLAPLDSMVYVTKEPDADTDQVRDRIERVIADLPTVTVKDPEGYADQQKGQINQFLYLIYGLLGLSVVIAILGVVNTLGLSVIERTREVGLLRAVGLSRRQLRTMIRLESVAVVVFGAVLGLVMGVAFGTTIVKALADQGLTDVAVPWWWLAGFLAAAVLLGVLAAVFPARRAARLNVLRAIATE